MAGEADMTQGFRKLVLIMGLALVWLAAWGCGESRAPFAGHYRSEAAYAGKGHIDLTLKENGEATWKLEQDPATLKFKWKVEGKQLFMYTKEGAVLIVNPTEDGKKLSMDISGSWHASCPVDQCITFVKVSGER